MGLTYNAQVREMLDEGKAALRAQKRQLVSHVLSNQKNRFTKEYLRSLSLDELRGMAALANAPGGQTTFVRNSERTTEKPLPLPSMDFGGKR